MPFWSRRRPVVDHALSAVADEQLNPVAIAREIGEAQVTFDDDRLDPDHGLKTFTNPWESHRAEDLGAAAASAVLAEGLSTEIAANRSAAAAGHARLETMLPIRDLAEHDLATGSRHLDQIDQVPLSTITPKRRFLSKAFKVAFFVGDSGTLSVLFWKAGSPFWIALPMGLSTAASMVAVGSAYGHRRAAYDHREERGDAPVDCPQGIRSFFREAPPSDLGENEHWEPTRSDKTWLIFMGVVAVAMLLGLTMLGMALKDTGLLAFGSALLAAATLPGSAAAEAYGTNDAADHRDRLLAAQSDRISTVARFADDAATTAAAEERAVMLHAGLLELAASAALQTRWIAGKEPEHPRIFDVDRPEGLTSRERSPIDFDLLPTLDRYATGRVWSRDRHEITRGAHGAAGIERAGVAGGSTEPHDEADPNVTEEAA